MDMNKVLMVMYHFPPVATAAALRNLKFAKYLPRFLWKPVVLTVRNPDRFMVQLDPNHTEDKLYGAKIFRGHSTPLGWILKTGRLGINYKWFLPVDVFIGWLPFATHLGRKIIAKEKIDLIYASCPPATGLIIGAFLGRITKKPLVVEYQDLWTGNPFTLYPSSHHQNLEETIEERVLQNCEAVVTASKRQKEDLVKGFPFLKETDVHVITNGFDYEDFSDVKPHRYDRFTIVHTGTIYGPRVGHFKIFLKALHRLLKSERVPDLQVVLVGISPSGVERDLTKFIHELGLTAKVLRLGLKSHKETIRFVLGADILLLVPGSSSVVPIKTSEYLAAGKFIFNISNPSGETAQMIDEAKAGVTVKPDVSSVQESLRNVLVSKDHSLVKSPSVLKQFSLDELTKKLVSVFFPMVRSKE